MSMRFSIFTKGLALLLVLAISMAFMQEGLAYHCTNLKDAADDARENWAAAMTVYVTTAAAMTITCAQAVKTKNQYLIAACAVAVAATAAASWWMGVQAGRYYEAADRYAAC